MKVFFSSFPHFDTFGFIQYQLHTFFQFSIHVRKKEKKQMTDASFCTLRLVSPFSNPVNFR